MEIGALVAISLFLLTLTIGLPIGWVFLVGAISGVLILGGDLNFMASTFYHSINNYVLMAVAFFVFAGSLISATSLADRIVRFSHALVGKVRGGLVLVGIIATVIMSALTGSSLPTISALIPLMVPRLAKLGYKKAYSTAVLCSASFLGYLIPPSVPALIYCMVAQQSVAALFLATVIPGLLLAAGYAVLNYFICPRYMIPIEDKGMGELQETSRIRELVSATWSALPALGVPTVILVGIYGGIFTPNEAGAVAVVYCLIIGFFVYRDLNRKSLKEALYSAVLTQGMMGLLLGGGTVFTRFLIRQGAAQAFAGAMLGLFDSKILVLLSVNVFLLILGMFIDGIPILILAVPMILPLMVELDVNLIHLGAIVIVNVGLGVVTPPYAISIFVGQRLAGVGYGELVKPMMVFFILVGVPVLLLTTYIPALSCWLPTLILGPRFVGPW
ncbi:MAG TPA: TRAP transporter large permease [Synergistaceae bacterium]|nr:TRAP transporter large permease [Synergistaceae bacterium]